MSSGMRHWAGELTLGLAALVWGTSARAVFADTPANPYWGIASRNVFRLKALEPHVPPVAPAPLPRVVPVGITTMLGPKYALLKIYLPASPPEPARELACTLAVGQREGPIEVLEIDETAGSVRINNSGTVMLLTLAKDGPQPQATPLRPSTPPPILPPVPIFRAGR